MSLKLDNQLCFALYSGSRHIVRLYQPVLAALDLTYTQYITMLVLWEHGSISMKELGDKLYLDSGTLTPLLKKLEALDLVKRVRSESDERVVDVTLTEKGQALKEEAKAIPTKIASCLNLTRDEAYLLQNLLKKLIHNIESGDC